MKCNNRNTSHLLIVILFFGFNSFYGQKSEIIERTKTNIDNNWNYLENETANITEAKNATNWVALNLPHSWNSLDATDNDPGYRRSASWYKKNLVITNIDPNKLYKLYFEGSNITTKVYVNGTEVGGHIGGYIGFTLDISKFIKEGSNEVLVRVDNSYNIEVIPSQKSDFIIYGGITRDVWLLTMSKNNIDNIQITTPQVSEKSATLNILATVKDTNTSNGLTYVAQLTNPKGKIVASQKGTFSGETTSINFKKIKNPELWDINKPNEVNTTPFWKTSFDQGYGILPTYIVTTGIVGILSWIAFFILLVFYGIKYFLFSKKNNSLNMEVVLFYIMSLYLFFAALFFITITMTIIAALTEFIKNNFRQNTGRAQ
jgi:beta-galactosidase